LSRIERAFRVQYAQLSQYWEGRSTSLDIEEQLQKAKLVAKASSCSLAEALTTAYCAALTDCDRDPVAGPSRRRWIERVTATGVRLACDASLGGLARWLRAYGYQSDSSLAARSGPAWGGATAITITSSGDFFERAMLRRPPSLVLWQPSQVNPKEQLRCVAVELRLDRRDPRCMTCGGMLRHVSKEDVRPRIPPRTARWLESYFVCEDCRGLFWQGTHWQRIEAHLSEVAKALRG
jgi:uncharacterized protein